ncbi:MAG: CCA tRNA nucleotidyltransferase [Chloroflexi bacterium]|nr:CCA tRNA nucleotidyltransferase [Chloroflexota bacterium]MCI0894858.1 CCA tRNA nucleotidyltransferase [Chloroflexota bacterium]
MLIQDTEREPAAAVPAALGQFFSARETPAFLVGGYVRDLLLSVGSWHDVDIAVQGDAGQVAQDLASSLGGVCVPLSPRHGIARVVVARPPQDGQTSDEAPSGDLVIDIVGYLGSIEEELARRDFTIDALALPLGDGSEPVSIDQVIDPFNGREDLTRKCIRALGPGVFRDDPGRLLRGVRLAAQLKFRLDPETAALMSAEAPRISQVSGDRLRDEFLLLLSLDGARGHLQVLDRLDLLCRVIPELTATKGVEQPRVHYWDVWDHVIHSVEYAELVTKGHQNSPVYSLAPWTEETEQYFSQQVSDGHTRRTLLKLAALLHDIAKPQTKNTDETGRTRFLGHSELGATMADARLRQLRLSSRGISMVTTMVAQHLRPTNMSQGDQLPSNRAIYRYFRDLDDVAIDTLYLCLADYLAAKGPDLSLDDWVAHTQMISYILQTGTQQTVVQKSERLVTGHDLMDHFHLSPGPIVGELLDRIGEARAAGEVTTREEALAEAAEALAGPSLEGRE